MECACARGFRAVLCGLRRRWRYIPGEEGQVGEGRKAGGWREEGGETALVSIRPPVLPPVLICSVLRAFAFQEKVSELEQSHSYF